MPVEEAYNADAADEGFADRRLIVAEETCSFMNLK